VETGHVIQRISGGPGKGGKEEVRGSETQPEYTLKLEREREFNRETDRKREIRDKKRGEKI